MAIKFDLEKSLQMTEEVAETAEQDIKESGVGTASTNSSPKNEYDFDESSAILLMSNINALNEVEQG